MNLQETLDLINYISNKDISGNTLKPTEYNNILQASNIDYYKQKYGLPEQYSPGAPLPQQSYEITQKITDDMRIFKTRLGGDKPMLVVDEDGMAQYPADYVHCSSILFSRFTNNADCTVDEKFSPVEVLPDSMIGDRLSDSIKKPTLQHPVATMYDKYIQFYPKNLRFVAFTYLRTPATPVYAYTTVDDEPVYDADASTQFEWPEDCHMDLVRIMLGYIGINMRESQLSEYAEAKKQQGI